MRVSLLLCAAAALVASLLCVSSVSAATTDCSLRNLVVNTPDGPLALTPNFQRARMTGYTLTVPYATEFVWLTAYAYASGPGIYMSYGHCEGANCSPRIVGNSALSGQQSQELPLAVGLNKVIATETCNCVATYEIVVTRQTLSFTKGDPLFAGILGQQFQVHGVAGEVYSIISDPVMQMNSRFVFLNHGDCPILNGKKAAACWSHPGSYLGEIGIKTIGGDKLFINSGSAKHGFSKVQLNGKDMQMDDVVDLQAGESDAWVSRNSTHLVTVQLSNFLLQIENSDHFVNYRLRVLNWENLPGTHGLLGQTYQKPIKPGKQIKEIEGDVDMYSIKSGSIWGDDFAFNRFMTEKKELRQSRRSEKSNQ